ncbi:hypothetical protein Megvenef_00582 [Candidatus Megaera venefica]|uniref:Uncharacterized protein n=1 Tax=Candidatus Megaera venefica TaxID=2055910 RepID=A0ABU5NBQ6_9RICK|nr:hypothetical protein [Candidatus Megaera venefica]MEA0970615.1 hypothetical protein [Candidatus Megaera venefica]
MARISANQNVKEAISIKDLPLLTPNSPNQHGYKNAIKAFSLDTAHGLAKIGDIARERLSFHVNKGEKWALELYFKIFTQLFDKSWLSRIDLSDIQLKIDNKEDKDEVVRYLMTKLLAVGTIEVTEAKDIVKMLTTMSLNDKLSHSLANKMSDEDVIKIMTMINAVKTD